MRFLLDFSYVLLLLLFSPCLVYSAIRHGKYREGLAQKLLGRVPMRTSNRPCIWLHAVSVGELNVVARLLTELLDRMPQFEYIISTTTKTGFDLARSKFARHQVFYCPLDFSWSVNTAFDRLRPTLLVLTELEVWPNLIHVARQYGAKVAVVNGRMSHASWRGYRRFKVLLRHVFRALDFVGVQSEEYAERFVDLGVPTDKVLVTGSLKFDGAMIDRNNDATRRLANLAGIQPGDRVFLAGSTQYPEDEMALKTYTQLVQRHPNLKLILVPRHPRRFAEVARVLDQSGQAWQRRSRIERDGLDRSARILLIDAVGELGAWWGAAHIAFVGGSMGRRGGQNMIEPAAYGAAVCFGPNTKNFRQVVQMMISADAAVVIHDDQALTAFVMRCLEDEAYANQLGTRARDLVRQNLGATEITAAAIQRLLQSHAERDDPALPSTCRNRGRANSKDRPAA